MSQTAEAAEAAPPAHAARRRFISGFIVVFLVYHIVAPLRYYAGSETDERFAWPILASPSRMQPVDLQRRSVVVTETVGQGDRRVERTVPVHTLVSQRWTRFFKRGSDDVIAAFLRWRQQQTAAVSIRMDLKRVEPDGSLRRLASFALERDGRLVRSEESAP